MDNKELREIKDYWCKDTADYSIADRDQRNICQLITAVEQMQAEVEQLRTRCDQLGDSLYNKDPDLAERHYNIIPTWKRENDW